jgi:hypothetical protein
MVKQLRPVSVTQYLGLNQLPSSSCKVLVYVESCDFTLPRQWASPCICVLQCNHEHRKYQSLTETIVHVIPKCSVLVNCDNLKDITPEA